jgi:hypothetical protein
MDDLINEQRISLSALAKREGVNVSTCWRWCLRGVKGHHLESLIVGGRRYTTVEAFVRFVERTSAGIIGEPAPTPSRTYRQRQAAIEWAQRELDRAGV